MRQLFFFLPLLLSLVSVAQSGTVTLDAQHYAVDRERKLILAQLDLDAVADDVGTIGLEDFTVALGTGDSRLRYDTSYAVTDPTGATYSLYLTRLPLVQLVTTRAIESETKHPASFTFADGEEVVESTVGIEFRGKFSLRFPKKSFDLEFWEDAGSRESVDVTFGDFREDDDWILDALYNEPLRVNGFVAHQVWLDMHQPYYLAEEKDALAGVRVKYVEVFLDGDYHGVYMLSEQLDRKQLQLKKFEDGEIRGELYRSVLRTPSTRFEGRGELPAAGRVIYDGWELQYPDEDDVIDFSKLSDLLDFAANSSDETFRREAAERLRLDAVRDYFLFLNGLSLVDNNPLNTFLARYREEEPYFFLPWDFDAALGNNFDGQRFDTTDFYITNTLQDRLQDLSPEGYNFALCARYQELRKDILDPDRLIARLDTQVDYLRGNGVYRREALRWGDAVDSSDELIDYYRNHITERIAYLDGFICQFATSTSDPTTVPLSVYPNPTADRLYVEHSFASPQSFQLLTLTGRNVLTGRLATVRDGIDVSSLPGGLYVLRVADYSARVVINR